MIIHSSPDAGSEIDGSRDLNGSHSLGTPVRRRRILKPRKINHDRLTRKNLPFLEECERQILLSQLPFFSHHEIPPPIQSEETSTMAPNIKSAKDIVGFKEFQSNHLKLKDGKFELWYNQLLALFALNSIKVDLSAKYSDLDVDAKAESDYYKHLITMAIDQDTSYAIATLTNIHDVVQELQRIFVKTDLTAAAETVHKITSKRFKLGDNMLEYLIDFKKEFHMLEKCGQKLENNIKVSLIINSLPNELIAHRAAILGWESSRQTVENVESYLRETPSFTDDTSSALAANYYRGGRKRGFNNRHNSKQSFKKYNNDSEQPSTSKKRNFSDKSSNKGNWRNHRSSKAAMVKDENQPHDQNYSSYDDSDSCSDSRDPNNANLALHRSPMKKMSLKAMRVKQRNERRMQNLARSVIQDNSKRHQQLAVNSVSALHRLGAIVPGSPSKTIYEGNSQEREARENALLASSDDELIDLHVSKHDINFDTTYVCLASAAKLEDINWILDSGASSHMCSNKSHFKYIKKSKKSRGITIADGSSIPIRGVGTVELIFGNESGKKSLTLENVLYAPDLKMNLLSIRNLTNKQPGVKVTFGDEVELNINGERTKLGGFKDGTYQLDLVEIGQRVVAATCIHEWHRKLCHRNLEDVKRQGLSIAKCNCSDECIPCQKGKMPRLPFPKVSEKPSNPLDLVVSDVCQVSTQTPGKALYFLTFVDAATDYTEVAVLVRKSDAPSAITKYIEKMKTQTGRKPKIFRSDQGGEFIQKNLQNYFDEEGIKYQYTVHDSPQQNGIAERKNRTLMNAVRSMLIDANLPKTLWAEALNHALFTLNRTRTKTRAPPIEMFFGIPVEQTFFLFGQDVFVATKEQGRKKLDDRATMMKFVGIDPHAKGLRLWNGKKVCIERNVKFAEIDESNTQLASVAIIPANSEPATYLQAINCVESDKWQLAITEEYQALINHGTWEFVELPPGRVAIGSKWVFKLKKDEFGVIKRYKARLVAQGYTQEYQVDYEEVFAPVVEKETIRVLLSLAGTHNWVVQQYDVTTAFLNGLLQEEIYMSLPKGFGETNKVCRLIKSLYGLKQAARVWNSTIHETLVNINFVQSKVDKCLYIYKHGNDICYLVIHVDDLLIASPNKSLIESLAEKIALKFDIKSEGAIRHFLGMDIIKTQNGAYAISQETYINKIASELDLTDIKPSKFPLDKGFHAIVDVDLLPDNKEYRKLIGILLYVAKISRPDLGAAVSILAQRIESPRPTDLREVKRAIKYLITTKTRKLMMSDPGSYQELTIYSDANWAEDRHDRKSITGVICNFNGGTVEWIARKQSAVSKSSTEAEYYALCEAASETLYLKQLLSEFGINTEKPIKIFCDNQSCVKLADNEKLSSRTKHIDVRYHFVKDLVKTSVIDLIYVPTEMNVADLMTKPLSGVRIEKLTKIMNMKN